MKSADWEKVLKEGCFITNDVQASIKQVATLLASKELDAHKQGMTDALKKAINRKHKMGNSDDEDITEAILATHDNETL